MSGFGTTTWRSSAHEPRKSRVQHVRPVGRRNQDNTFIRLEAVHLNQQLIQCLLSLIVTATKPGAAMTADASISSINKRHGAFFFACSNMSRTRRADADEHFNEFRPRNCEERHVCFTGDRARQQGFTSSRRTDKQDPFRNAPAKPLKLPADREEIQRFLPVPA